MKTIRIVLLIFFLLIPSTGLRAAGYATSDNFTVFTATLPSRAQETLFARALLQNAESYRREIAKEWLGEELPPSVGPTTVNVAFSDERDSGLVWVKDDPRRKCHMLYMTTSPDKALGSTLAHEMVHIVFATRFPAPNRLAAWLEEGVASAYDDPSRETTRKQIISWIARTGNWPRLDAVLSAKTIPAGEKEMYAVAASLTQFLLARRDKKTFIAFGQDAREAGWDHALQKYYQLTDVSEFQSAWQQWVRKSGTKDAGG